MLRKKCGEIEWFEFALLQEEPVVHGIFSRRGGISPPPFDSLNVKEWGEDQKENVLENRKRVNHVLNLAESLYVNCEHKDGIYIVEGNQLNERADGLVTRQRGIGIGFSIADCQAAIFYDPINQVIANVHAGWRGQVLQIYTKTIECLKAKFSTRPEDLLVCISPSLGPTHSEFIHYKKELPPSFWSYQFKPNYFNLWEVSREELLRCGVLSHHIEMAEICTYEHPHDFFSYRRDHNKQGMAAIAALKM